MVVIQYKCACGKVYQSDESAAGRQVRCRACGSVLTVPDLFDAAAAAGTPEGEIPLSPGCPMCGHPFAAGQVICTACGYDTVTEQKMRTDLGDDAPQTGKPPAEKARPNSRPIAMSAAIIAVILLLVAILWRVGPVTRSLEAERQLILKHVTAQLEGTGYEPGEFTQFDDEGHSIRFVLPIEDAAGLEVGTATGKLGRVDGGEPKVKIRYY